MTRDMRPRFKVFKDYNGEFKWCLLTARDESIAEAPYGFKQKAKCVQAVSQVKETMKVAEAIIVE